MRVYLDHQAATPALPDVLEAMRPYFADRFGNPSSLQQEAHLARAALDRARAQMAAFLNAEDPENIIFTSTGTESVNLAIKGAFFANQKRGRHVITSAIDHPAVTRSITFLESLGCICTKIPVDEQGRVDPQALQSSLRDDTILVCLHQANHDIGAIQPLEQIGALLAERGILFFVDAIASAGWMSVDVQKWNASLVAISPHRFYGPKGVGVLYRNRRARLSSLIHGGDQEDGRRAGTENIPAIVGGGVAAEIATREWQARAAHVRKLQELLWTNLQREIQFLKLNGPPLGAARHPGNLNLSVEFVEGEALALTLDMRGVALASGSACVTKNLQIPPVLAAIGLDESLAKGNVLITLGKDNTVAEVDYLVNTFARTVSSLREMSPTWDDFQKGVINSKIHPAREASIS
jgi:cysteine desulfurase